MIPATIVATLPHCAQYVVVSAADLQIRCLQSERPVRQNCLEGGVSSRLITKNVFARLVSITTVLLTRTLDFRVKVQAQQGAKFLHLGASFTSTSQYTEGVASYYVY